VGLAEFIVAAGLVGLELVSIMALAWYVQQRTGNSGWVDATWSFGVGATGCFVALLPFVQQGWHWRQFLVAALAALWCIRLGCHIAMRSRGSADDPRYRELTDTWGEDAPRRMFWFLQSQAAVGIILALAIVLAAQNPDPAIRLQDIAGSALLFIAIAGETLADRQLRSFRANPANRGAVCDVGLWRWSRHPNYFFEWLAWLSYPVIAIDFGGHNPFGWFAVLAPACMYYVLVHVSGIPPLEAHMLRSRGDAFRAYQARTRAFFPLP
jgi:steroid 5-alpha reductase family enzyme